MMKTFQYILVGAAVLLASYVGLKATLERLIIDNYVKREMGILPDKLYWADGLYMDLCGRGLMWGCHGFYSRQAQQFLFKYDPELYRDIYATDSR